MPLLNGTHRVEYLIAAILGALFAVGGVVILLVPGGPPSYGIPLLVVGTAFAVLFGREARRRYSSSGGGTRRTLRARRTVRRDVVRDVRLILDDGQDDPTAGVADRPR